MPEYTNYGLDFKPIVVDFTRREVLIDGKPAKRLSHSTFLSKVKNRLFKLLFYQFNPHHAKADKYFWDKYGVEKKVFNINSKLYEIPRFHNIILEYEFYDDYARYIDRIVIDKYYKTLPPKPRFWDRFYQPEILPVEYEEVWYARFWFKEIPRKGYMVLKYM